MSKVQRVVASGMTVARLRDKLEGCPDEAVVVFVCDYGDHCHTPQALPVCSVEEEGRLYETAYSESGVALRDEGDERGTDDDHAEVVVLRS